MQRKPGDIYDRGKAESIPADSFLLQKRQLSLPLNFLPQLQYKHQHTLLLHHRFLSRSPISSLLPDTGSLKPIPFAVIPIQAIDTFVSVAET